MKKIIIPLVAASLLGGCAAIREFFFGVPDEYNWSNDCLSHYSTTGREESDCRKKVEADKKRSIPGEEVTMDLENAKRESFDDIGKGGASDNSGGSSSGGGGATGGGGGGGGGNGPTNDINNLN